MKALSLKQPWAWAIFHAGKDIENRSWPTNYRGPVIIHSSKSIDWEGYHWLREPSWGLTVPRSYEFEFGVLLGIVEIKGCVPKYVSRWFFGPWGFVLENPRLFEKPIPWKGQLGFFEVPDNVLEVPNNVLSR